MSAGGFVAPLALAQSEPSLGLAISQAAIERTGKNVVYDASYERIGYPMGDVADNRGVCADVVVRVLRTQGIDLQALLHEDMKAAFDAYPAHWGLSRPDANIDHRRVPNLETYLTRIGARLPDSADADDYAPGDIVAWNLKGASGGWLPHIGVVTDRKTSSGRPLIVHNIGAGPQLEDVLFSWKITGRYRLPSGARGVSPSPR
ncbi:MAG: DUF1287 domain-containing protein [Pseudomonadota bacterium]